MPISAMPTSGNIEEQQHLRESHDLQDDETEFEYETQEDDDTQPDDETQGDETQDDETQMDDKTQQDDDTQMNDDTQMDDETEQDKESQHGHAILRKSKETLNTIHRLDEAIKRQMFHTPAEDALGILMIPGVTPEVTDDEITDAWFKYIAVIFKNSPMDLNYLNEDKVIVFVRRARHKMVPICTTAPMVLMLGLDYFEIALKVLSPEATIQSSADEALDWMVGTAKCLFYDHQDADACALAKTQWREMATDRFHRVTLQIDRKVLEEAGSAALSAEMRELMIAFNRRTINEDDIKKAAAKVPEVSFAAIATMAQGKQKAKSVHESLLVIADKVFATRT